MNKKHSGQNPEKISTTGKPKRRLFIRAFLISFTTGLIGVVALVLLIGFSPATGAQGADLLRSLLGNKPVAEIEAFVFTLQDTVHQMVFRLDRSAPTAPWTIPTGQGISTSGTGKTGAQNLPNLVSNSNPSSGSNPSKPVRNPASNPSSKSKPILANILQPAKPTSGAVAWVPANLTPLGSIAGEGVWTAYIQDQSGNTLAYKTFLQPDPERPYVVVGIVAFDLTRVSLHYQLGTLEPVSSVSITRTGEIPSSDRMPGILLAAFNGGFKSVHGHYGVFIDNYELIPPINGMGTIAVYQDGSIRIGEWGADMNYSPDMVVYRQNCPLIVQNGEINPQVYNNSINDWGGTISGNIVTFRSGIGLSQDGKTLYYFAGNSLTMPALAKSMQDAGAYQAMQLDINNYYVHFTKFDVQNGQLVANPLLPKEMVDNVDRFLGVYSRDFFYVTTNQP